MMDEKRYVIDTYISPLNTVVRSDSKETLGTLLSLVRSSHSPVFIFTKDDVLFGIISPYQAFYSHRHPYSMNASSIAFMPPHINANTPLYDVASFMLSTRVYVLPVYGVGKQLKGVVHIKEVLKNLIRDPDLLTYLSVEVKPRKPITAHINSRVGEVYQAMREKGVSRVVLVDDEGNLAGIASRKDLLKAYMKPTSKQRFGKDGNPQTNRSYDVEKIFRKDDPVKKYSTMMANSLPAETDQKEMIRKLLSSEHNSVILINKINKPVGFLSMRDLIDGLASLRPEEEINIIIQKPSNAVADIDLNKAQENLRHFAWKMKKRMAIEKIELSFEEPKNPDGQTAVFNTTLIFTPVAGGKFVAKTKNKAFLDGVQRAIEEIEKQENRSGLTKEETKYAHI